MNKINKTLAIAAIAVASTFASQSAKAQDTFGTDFSTPISVEVQPEAEADFSISSFDDEIYMDNSGADRNFLKKTWKLGKMLTDPNNRKIFEVIKDMYNSSKKLTVDDVIAKLKSLGHGILVTTVSVGVISFFITMITM